jgi:hypothetical protein
LSGIGGPALDGPERVSERMRHAISAVSSDLSVTSVVRRGRVATELARAAEVCHASAIVVGTDIRPQQRIGRSVGTRISLSTAIPVIAVSGTAAAAARDGARCAGGRFGQVGAAPAVSA